MLTPFLLLAQVAAPPPPPPPTLPPIGKWSVDYGDRQCLVTRAFGDPAHPVTLAFDSVTGTLQGDLFLILGGKIRDDARGRAKVTLDNGATYTLPWVSAPAGPGKYVLRLMPDYPFWDAVTTATTMLVERANGDPFVLPVRGMAKVAAATKLCGDSLLRSWGADPERMIAPPQRSYTWFNANDYPPAAVRSRQQGLVGSLTTIASDGRPIACRVVEGSGFSLLDEVTCKLIMTRATFDAASLPMRYLYMRTRWVTQ